LRNPQEVVTMASNNNQNLSGAAQAFGMGRADAVEEEQPAMRSVAVSSRGPALDFGSSIGGPRFGKAPPLGISRPTGKTPRSSSVTVRKEWNEENWKITDPLEKVPLDFPLERTHREIYGVSANEVAKRISNALRLLSVDAHYDNENAKVKCTTNDCVSFRIRLFAGGEDGLPVIVEVQRRSGSPSSFMRVCRKILDGAEGNEVKAVSKSEQKKVPSFMKTPVGEMKCLKDIPMKNDPETRVNGSLDKSMDLLRSEQKDTNILGLENLCHLTDPLKTRPDMALMACKAIMFDSKCSDVRDEVCVMLQKDAFLQEEFDDEEEAATNLGDISRHMALILLSNTLALTSKDGCLDDAVKREKWFADFLIPTLLDEVKSFEKNANNAYEAACGLSSLASCSEAARHVMGDNSAAEDLRSAHDFGIANHELLANETERALKALTEVEY